jgi:hypothetical protein
MNVKFQKQTKIKTQQSCQKDYTAPYPLATPLPNWIGMGFERWAEHPSCPILKTLPKPYTLTPDL